MKRSSTRDTGDVWLFRGPTTADKAIRLLTNSPVNHVAMVVALDDLPPLLWHTELGQSLPSVWSGDHHRGAQLHRLDRRDHGVDRAKYKQRAWVRHFDGEVTHEMEDAVLRVVAEYEGRAFPRTRQLAGKWLAGRLKREASEEAVYCAELAGDHVHAHGPARRRAVRRTGSIPVASGAATGSSCATARASAPRSP